MHLTRSQYPWAYKTIKDHARDTTCSVLLLVAPTPDALAACKIWTSLLRSDFVAYKIIPIGSFENLSEINETLIAGNDDIKSIVMLECGATDSLAEYLSLSPEQHIYVIDSHRPLNLDNILVTPQVVFLDDGEVENIQDEVEAFKKILEINQVIPPDVEDAESSSDSEEDLDVDEEERDRRYLEKEQKRKERAKLRSIRLECVQMVEEYYEGSSTGQSAALTSFMLSKGIQKPTNDLLWMAVIGVTSQMVAEQLTFEKYEEEMEELSTLVSSLNPPLDAQEERSMSGMEEGRILNVDEFRFMLYRHWSLYQGMYHSTYVATRLAIWKDKGKRRLENLLTTMGFSLAESQQAYEFMSQDSKKILKEKITLFAPDYELDDVCFPSFGRSYGFQGFLSGSDVVHALNALLQIAPEVASRLEHHIDWAEEYGVTGAVGGNDDDTNEDDTTTNGNASTGVAVWTRSFFTAYDALSSLSMLQNGMQLAMKLQKVIVQQGILMMEKQSITTHKSFRFSMIKEAPDLVLFLHPIMLTSLAKFLSKAIKTSRRTDLPLVLAAFDEAKQTFELVGLTKRSALEGGGKNHFGAHFRRSADAIRAHYKHNTFEDSVIQLDKHELSSFVEMLGKNVTRDDDDDRDDGGY